MVSSREGDLKMARKKVRKRQPSIIARIRKSRAEFVKHGQSSQKSLRASLDVQKELKKLTSLAVGRVFPGGLPIVVVSVSDLMSGGYGELSIRVTQSDNDSKTNEIKLTTKAGLELGQALMRLFE